MVKKKSPFIIVLPVSLIESLFNLFTMYILKQKLTHLSCVCIGLLVWTGVGGPDISEGVEHGPCASRCSRLKEPWVTWSRHPTFSPGTPEPSGKKSEKHSLEPRPLNIAFRTSVSDWEKCYDDIHKTKAELFTFYRLTLDLL